jgi:hypothetical protein
VKYFSAFIELAERLFLVVVFDELDASRLLATLALIEVTFLVPVVDLLRELDACLLSFARLEVRLFSSLRGS